MVERFVSNEAERIRKGAVLAKIHVITTTFTWKGRGKPQKPQSEWSSGLDFKAKPPEHDSSALPAL
jgi:hypothetical protein